MADKNSLLYLQKREEALLAAFLEIIVPGDKAADAAKKLMQAYGTAIEALMDDEEAIARAGDLPKSKIIYLKIFLGAFEYGHTHAYEHAGESVEKAAAYIMRTAHYQRHESAYLMLFDANKAAIGCVDIAEGDRSTVVFDPLDLTRVAQLYPATVGAVLVHNHPSGNPMPSQQDLIGGCVVWQELNARGIHLYDHIIIAGEQAFSFHAAGLRARKDAMPDEAETDPEWESLLYAGPNPSGFGTEEEDAAESVNRS